MSLAKENLLINFIKCINIFLLKIKSNNKIPGHEKALSLQKLSE